MMRRNGLSIVLFVLFIATWVGQWVTGWSAFLEDATRHGQERPSLWAYLASGAFWEATGENWESEFLQMGLFVILTSFLFQKGSPESNDPDVQEPEPPVTDRSPWPVRRGGLWAWCYAYSLSGVFLLLFAGSMAVHAVGGWRAQRDDALAHGEPGPSLGEYLGSSHFWFESMQNWQSEFLSLVAMVYLSVYLRHRGSAESKPVAAAHDDHE